MWPQKGVKWNHTKSAEWVLIASFVQARSLLWARLESQKEALGAFGALGRQGLKLMGRGKKAVWYGEGGVCESWTQHSADSKGD